VPARIRFDTDVARLTDCVQMPATSGFVVPADQDGAANPAGAEYIMGLGNNSLNVWRFAPNFAAPSAAELTGPSPISVTAFSEASVVPQPGTKQKLDALGYSPMYRLAYRSVGGTNYLTINHSVSPGSGAKAAAAGVRWYLLSVASATATPAVQQQGTYSPDTTSRWMGSMAMDKCGDIGIGYSVSASSVVYPGIRFAGRTPTDSAGTLETEIHLLDGAYSGTSEYWGTATDMRVDPADDRTFYYTNQYLSFSGSKNWSTAISKVRFTGCN